MPTYVYQCKKCGGRFEKVQRMTENPLSSCELRGCKGSVFRVIQPVGIQFKGAGFHINDYSPSNGRGKSKKPDGETKCDLAGCDDSKICKMKESADAS